MSEGTDDALEQALARAGNELAARLEELRDEFSPGEVTATDDLGWLSVEAALVKWRRLVLREPGNGASLLRNPSRVV